MSKLIFLCAEQLVSYRDAFALIDRDSSGTISKEELTQLLQSLQGRKPTEAEIKYIMDKIDIDRSGTIEFDEFLSLMSRPELSPTLSSRSTPKIPSFNGTSATATAVETEVLDEDEDELIQAFKVFDKDGSGKISITELESVMKQIGWNSIIFVVLSQGSFYI